MKTLLDIKNISRLATIIVVVFVLTGCGEGARSAFDQAFAQAAAQRAAGFQGFTRNPTLRALQTAATYNLANTRVTPTALGTVAHNRLSNIPAIAIGASIPYNQYGFPHHVPYVNFYYPAQSQFPLVVKLDDMSVSDINEANVRQIFLGVRVNIIQRYIVFQTAPNAGLDIVEQTLFRPHSWVHQNLHLGANVTSPITASWAINGRAFINFASAGITTHNDPNNTYLLFSPDNFHIDYFDPANTTSLYTICIDQATHDCAITYHVLLNNADHIAIDAIVGAAGATLDAFLTNVEHNIALSASIGVINIRNFIAGRVNI